jgi:hypothetical protein
MNPENSAEYLQSIHTDGPAWNRYFQHDAEEMKLLHFTRRLAALQMEKGRFQESFGGSSCGDYSEKITLLIQVGLLTPGEGEFA